MINTIFGDSLRSVIDKANELKLNKDNIISIFLDVERRYILIYDNKKN